MLVDLSIRDIVLIDRLNLAFDPGLSVLTGETGAGKSILLDALALALGGRGDGGLVRAGADQGQVTAAFDVPLNHPARAAAADLGLDPDGGLVLRRVQYGDGRTRAYVNDAPASAQALKAIGAKLVEIHGQHDDRALIDPASHRLLVDAYGELQGLAAEVAAAQRAEFEARRALKAHREAVEAARRDADYIRHAAEELAKLAPEPGEEDVLAERRAALQRAEKVSADLIEVHEALSGPDSPAPGVAAAMRRLERRVTLAPAQLEPAVQALEAALVAIEEAAGNLERALRENEHDPRELERVEERLFALRAAARKYGVPVDGLAAHAQAQAANVTALEQGEAQLLRLEAALDAADAAYLAKAKALSARRREAARALDAAVMAELPPLKLERAVFSTVVTSDEGVRAPEGIDRVEFHAKTNPGARPGPLLKVASGGELSRFLLALKVVLADRGSAPTLIFDEIDTGVGGAVADAIGKRLARLAQRVQVLSVTHAPQVAARAGRHMLILKEAAGETVVTRVEPLASPERREEIARMLAGETVTDEARAAAARLLAAA